MKVYEVWRRDDDYDEDFVAAFTSEEMAERFAVEYSAIEHLAGGAIHELSIEVVEVHDSIEGVLAEKREEMAREKAYLEGLDKVDRGELSWMSRETFEAKLPWDHPYAGVKKE